MHCITSTKQTIIECVHQPAIFYWQLHYLTMITLKVMILLFQVFLPLSNNNPCCSDCYVSLGNKSLTISLWNDGVGIWSLLCDGWYSKHIVWGLVLTLCCWFILGDVKVNLHFLSLLNTEREQVVEIRSGGRQGPIYRAHQYHVFWWRGDARSQGIISHSYQVYL